jgi:hypothetical protein
MPVLTRSSLVKDRSVEDLVEGMSQTMKTIETYGHSDHMILVKPHRLHLLPRLREALEARIPGMKTEVKEFFDTAHQQTLTWLLMEWTRPGASV